MAVSLVVAEPDALSNAAGHLAGIGSKIEDATAAGAGPTTTVAAAASDDVSIAISEFFGTYGKQFQTFSARAAAFHDEFVSLLRGGAAAYLDTEFANARLGQANPANSPAPAAAAPGGAFLAELSAGNTELGPITGAISVGELLPGAPPEIGAAISVLGGGSLLPGLFGFGPFAPTTGSPAVAEGPWQTLFANTCANLQTIYSDWAAHPFPAAQQVIANQAEYARTIGGGLAAAAQDLPATVANLPANIGLAVADAVNFPAELQGYLGKQVGYGQVVVDALQNAGAELPQTLPNFFGDVDKANQAVMAGDYNDAVDYVPRAAVDLFLSGVNINNLSQITVEGPAGELLPLMSLPAQMQQDLIDLLPPGAILTQMVQNSFNATSTVVNSIALAAIGPPIATLDGFATGLTVLRRSGGHGKRCGGCRRLARYARLRVGRFPQRRNRRGAKGAGERDGDYPVDAPDASHRRRRQHAGPGPDALRRSAGPAATDHRDNRTSGHGESRPARHHDPRYASCGCRSYPAERDTPTRRRGDCTRVMGRRPFPIPVRSARPVPYLPLTTNVSARKGLRTLPYGVRRCSDSSSSSLRTRWSARAPTELAP
ncbi:PE family protein [Mycobacterium pseudoshottsii]|uniref:PE domain-containing protein n=1 Tax=Mycobacterium pseudoshottsii TaxID=265949 RepID=A0A9N7QPN5_9MYCO|nr:PE family protein [Mycobacterium pseudoshottsii]BDN83290.1 hypothetical protein NJB1907Z4_C35050 [Mycobacterium pseudoshottsii]GAQ32913.1 PE-PGRS family protein [Mycobacterium pseudoshottsii JCM 15466]